MKITEVKVTLVSGGEDRLKAFCSVTFDDEFVVRDLRIIDGSRGLFLAMPSRRLSIRCLHCDKSTDADARYCSSCGKRLKRNTPSDDNWRPFSDIAHPINAECRGRIEAAVMAEYHAVLRQRAETDGDGVV